MENENMEMPSYWQSVIIGALVVSIIASIASTILTYYIAGAEPSMTMMIMASLYLPVTCLLGLIGGIIANRHYAKTFEVTYKLGHGALIGFFTGVGAAIFMTIISLLWTKVIDPALMENFANNMISAFDVMDMPAEQKEQSINRMMNDLERQNSVGGILTGFGINAAALGVINALSGMLGAKLFAKEEE